MNYKVANIIGLLFLSIGVSFIAKGQNQLDKLGLGATPTSQTAYSTRKVSSAYNGYAMRVRRSSDNAHVDVDFNNNDEVGSNSLVKYVEGISLTASLGTLRTGTITTRLNRTGTITLQPNLTGTISGISGANVTGTGTAFNTQLAINDRLYTTAGAFIGYVEAIASATSLTLGVSSPTPAYTGTFRKQTTIVTGSGTSFTTELAVGDKLYNQATGAFLGEVVQINSNTELLVKSIGATAATGVSFATTSTLVTGVGTNFTTELSVGDLLIANNITLGIIATITNNTSLTLETKAGGSVNANTYRSTSGTQNFSGFISGTSAFISNWYDQSGNNRHMSQPIPANQPRIATSGSFEIVNSRIVARFITTDETFIHTEMPASWLDGTPYSILSVSRPLSTSSTNSYQISTLGNQPGINNRILHHGFRSATQLTLDHFSSTANFSTLLGDALEVITAVKLTPANNGSRMYRNSSLLGTATNPSTFLVGPNPFALGRYRELFMDGYVCEAVVFSSVLSDADRLTLEGNQSTFYNIERAVWTGDVNTDWNNPGNWIGSVPSASTPVTFINNTTNKPNITAISAEVNRIEVEAGATITIGSGGSLTINGVNNIIPAGTINATQGTVKLGGALTFNPNIFTSNTVGNLTINTSGTATITGNLVIKNSLHFTQGKLSINGNTLTLNGSIINTVTEGLIGSATSNLFFNGSNSTLSFDQSTINNRSLNNLTINAPGQTLTLGNQVRINGDLTITTGTYNLGSNTSNRDAAGGTLTIGTFGALIIGGTNPFPTNFNTHAISTGSTIEFSGANQNISALNSSQSYFNLRLSGSGTKTFTNSITDIGSIFIATGVNVDLNAITTHTTNDLYFNSVPQISGTWGNTGSGATNINATFFTGSGRITVNNSTRVWNGNVSTDWNDANNWTPNTVPTVNENVVIPNVTNQPILANNLACRSVLLQTGSTLTVNNTFTLTVNGDFITNGGTQVGAGTIAFNGVGRQISGTSTSSFSNVNIIVPATIALNNTMTAASLNIGTNNNGSCSFTQIGSSSVTVSGAVNIAQSANNSNSRRWNINGGTATVDGLLSYTGTNTSTNRIQEIVITTGTLNANAGITFADVANGSRIITMSGGNGKLNLQGALTLNGSQTLNMGIAGATFNYTGTTAQTVSYFSAGAYHNLEVSNTGGVTLPSGITVANVTGNVLVSNGTLNNGGFAIAGNGTQTLQVNNGATLNLGGTTSAFPTGFGTVILQPTSTVNYSGTGAQTIVVQNYGNLTSSSSGARTLQNTGTIGVATTFTPGTNTYTTTGSTVDFNGTGAQTIPVFSFNNLIVSGARIGSPAITLASGTINVAGNFTNTSTGIGSFVTTGNTMNFNGAAQNIGTFTFNNLTASGTGDKTATGNLTVNGALTINASRTLNMGTNTLAGATLTTSGTGTLTTQNTSNCLALPADRTWSMTVNYNNTTGGQSILGGTYADLTMGNTSGTNTVCGALTVNGSLTVPASTILNMGTNTLAGATMTAVGTGTIQTQNTSANPLPAGRTWSMNVEYNNATGGQSVVGGTFTNLTSGNTSGTNTATGALTVNSQLNVVAGTTLDMGTNTLAGATMTAVGTGTIQTQNTSANPLPAGRTWSMTVEYNNATGGQSVVGGTYENLISGLTSGTNTATGALTINNELTVRDGTILNMGTNILAGATMTTSGTGTLQTQNTSATPLPAGIDWSMTVSYNSASAQTIVDGSYTNLDGAGGDRTLSTLGTIFISEVFTPGVGTYTTTGSTVNFNGGLQNVPPITGGYDNLSITGTDNKTATGNIAVNANLLIQNPLIFFMGNNDLTSSASPMTTSGTGTISTTSTSANPLPSGVTWTVEVSYDNPTGGQTVVAGTYSDLTFNNTSGTNTAGANFTVNDVLTITSGGILDMSTNVLTGGTGMTTAGSGTIRTANESIAPLPSDITWTVGVEYYSTNSQYIMPGQYTDLNASGGDRILPNGGTVAINDVFVPGAGIYTSIGSTVLFNGAAQSVPPITGGYNNLSVAGSGDKTASAALEVNGNLDIATGRLLDMGTHALTGTGLTTSGDGTIRTANESIAPLPSDITWTVGVEYYSTNSQYIMPGQYTDLNASGGDRILPNGGTVAINDEFVPGAGNYTSTGSTVLFNGAAQGVPPINGGYNNVSIAGTDDKTAIAALEVNGNLDIATGRILDMGTHALSGTTLTSSGDGVLRTANTTATPLPTDISWNIPVEYYAATGGQSIVTGSYTDLRVTNTSGTSTATGNLSISDALTLNGGIFSMGTHALSSSGTIATTGPGVLSTQNTSSTPLPINQTWNMDVHYNAPTTQTIVAGSYAGSLITSGSASKTLGGNATVTGTLDLSTKLTVGSNTLDINGGFSGSTTNSLTLNGSSNINIGGTSPSAMSLFIDQTTEGVSNAANNLTYNRSGATITLNDSLQVRGTITPAAGTLNTNNRLILVSNASGTARILAGTGSYITGNVRAERFIPQTANRAWRFLSSPVSGATLQDWRGEIFVTGPGTGTTVGTLNSNGFDATHNNSQTVFSYTESVSGNKNNGWTGSTHITNSIAAGRGYRVFVRGDRSDTSRISRNSTVLANNVTLDVVGPVNMGNISMPVTFTNTATLDDDGWNLVGNPYPCPIDWNAFHDNGRTILDTTSGTDYQNLEPTVWVFDPIAGNYKFYNAFADAGTLTNGIIGLGQAFWVKATAGSPTMTMRETYKSSSNPSEWFKTTENSLFTVKMSRDSSFASDEVLIKYRSGASINYDRFDVLKLPGTVTISAYGTDNRMLALSTRPLSMTQNDTIFLAVSGAQNSYRLDFINSSNIPVNDALYLVDNFTSTVVNLRTTSSYNFVINSNASSQGANRFYIVVSNNNPVPVDLLNFEAKLNKAKEVELKWTTTSEVNANHFELERSADGINYTAIARIKASGTPSGMTTYGHIDTKPEMVNYYRLKMIDKDGTHKYSSIRLIQLNNETGISVQLYPVPVSKELTVYHKDASITQIRVVSTWGQTLHTQQISMSQTAQVDMSRYAAGVYIIEVTDETGRITREQVVKE